jgi:hypothetical protein
MSQQTDIIPAAQCSPTGSGSSKWLAADALAVPVGEDTVDHMHATNRSTCKLILLLACAGHCCLTCPVLQLQAQMMPSLLPEYSCTDNSPHSDIQEQRLVWMPDMSFIACNTQHMHAMQCACCILTKHASEPSACAYGGHVYM